MTVRLLSVLSLAASAAAFHLPPPVSCTIARGASPAMAAGKKPSSAFDDFFSSLGNVQSRAKQISSPEKRNKKTEQKQKVRLLQLSSKKPNAARSPKGTRRTAKPKQPSLTEKLAVHPLVEKLVAMPKRAVVQAEAKLEAARAAAKAAQETAYERVSSVQAELADLIVVPEETIEATKRYQAEVQAVIEVSREAAEARLMAERARVAVGKCASEGKKRVREAEKRAAVATAAAETAAAEAAAAAKNAVAEIGRVKAAGAAECEAVAEAAQHAVEEAEVEAERLRAEAMELTEAANAEVRPAHAPAAA